MCNYFEYNDGDNGDIFPVYYNFHHYLHSTNNSIYHYHLLSMVIDFHSTIIGLCTSQSSHSPADPLWPPAITLKCRLINSILSLLPSFFQLLLWPPAITLKCRQIKTDGKLCRSLTSLYSK